MSTICFNSADAKTRKKSPKTKTTGINVSTNISGIVGLDEPWSLILNGVKGTLRDKNKNKSFTVRVDSFLGNFLNLSFFNQNGEQVGKISGVVEFKPKLVHGTKTDLITWFDGNIVTFYNVDIDDGPSTRFTFGSKAKKHRPNMERNTSASSISNINELLHAPSVTPNRDGFINRDNAPQSCSNVKAVPFITNDDNNVTTKIYIKGKLTQTLKSNYNFPDKGFAVYYLDFNYDGYIDIYVIAKEEPYGGAILFLWNSNLKKFEESNASAQYFSLHPSDKTINFYDYAMACMGDSHYEKCVFNNNKFEVIDEIVNFDCSENNNYYIGLGSYNRVSNFDCDKPNGVSYSHVSEEWRRIMHSFGDNFKQTVPS